MILYRVSCMLFVNLWKRNNNIYSGFKDVMHHYIEASFIHKFQNTLDLEAAVILSLKNIVVAAW